MKIICSDGVNRDFNYAFDFFVHDGVDPELLNNDGYRLALTTPPHVNLKNALNLINQGVPISNHLVHSSKNSRRKNPHSISIHHFLKRFKWISISPSFKYFNEYQLDSRAGIITNAARLGTLIWDNINFKFDGRDSFPYYVLGINKDEFRFSYGYEIIDYQHTNQNGGWIIADNHGTHIAISDSLLGYTKHIFLCEDDKLKNN